MMKMVYDNDDENHENDEDNYDNGDDEMMRMINEIKKLTCPFSATDAAPCGSGLNHDHDHRDHQEHVHDHDHHHHRDQHDHVRDPHHDHPYHHHHVNISCRCQLNFVNSTSFIIVIFTGQTGLERVVEKEPDNRYGQTRFSPI